MKVTYNWLKDFVDMRITPEALAQKLTMAGLEVTSLEERDGDFVFEIEITSNRPDWLSVIGIAREVAAITGKRINQAASLQAHKLISKILKPADYNLQLKIENKKDCPLYIGTIITGVRVGPSPDWLRKRLELVGCRSVNNIVDITNYVLFQTGEPLHAFDLDKLIGRNDIGASVRKVLIEIRRARNQEKIVTIDAAERILDPDILVIADAQKPVAIAGIMGGKDTEVTGQTRNLLLEAAVFNSVVIRRGRQKLGVQSEASYRFERNVVAESAQEATHQAIELIEKLGSFKAASSKMSTPISRKKKAISFNLSSAANFLGVNVTLSRARAILTSLGFRATGASGMNLRVQIPPYRQDVSMQKDLAEEIARIYGYDLVPMTHPAIKPQITVNSRRALTSSVKNTLAALGLQEVVTYSLIAKDDLFEIGTQAVDAPVEVLNPLSKDQEILRPNLLSGILNSVAVNLNRKQEYVNIFEIAGVFCRQEGKLQQEQILCVALCGARTLLLNQGTVKDEPGYLHLKGIFTRVFERLGVSKFDFHNLSFTENAAQIMIEADGKQIGFLAQTPKAVLERLGIKNREVFIAQVSLDKALALAELKKKVRPLAVYPAVRRDISFTVKDEVMAQDILLLIRQQGTLLLEDAQIIDYYKGKQIPAGQKALTISCIYRAHERTLTEAEVNPIHSAFCAALTERFQAVFR